MLPNSGSAACCSKANTQEATVGRKESCFNQKTGQSGEKVGSCPKTNSEDSAWPWKFLKGKREVISATEIGEQTHSRLPLHAGLLTPRDLSFYAILFTQFVCEITEGEAGEEICLSVNYLLFISTSLIYGKNYGKKVRQGIMWSKDLKGVLGLEMSRAWGCLFKTI